MPTYIILSTLTDEGWKHIKQKPERILEVNREIEEMGIKIEKQFALLGDYDFANIVEAPDNETVMRMSLELGSRGSVQFTTFPAVPVEEFIKSISKKKAA
ncbi:MAG: GYD domain superfamily [Nitrospirae bacterium GWD2_57_9]|nr:MAG: GYD domain superfamily [Nitrospirae bacterium GWD2_57_9]OGW48653.1 MAG: GYD domain superfamily [Nitrospirae bacterium GWC2_57_9]